jgi:penicillin amidase
MMHSETKKRTMFYVTNRVTTTATLFILFLTTLTFTNISYGDVTYTVKGISKPAEILVDEWGIPHIYAQDHYDAFFVQGFNAARDRLWQIDLWRRRGLGELSSVLGENFLEQDKAARMFLYRDDMFREWLAYGSDAKRISQAFTRGINAYVNLIKEKPELLPMEFRILGYEPAIWLASDVVRIRSNGLWRNVRSEAQRANIICQYGLETDALRYKLEPEWNTRIPEGLDPCSIPVDVTRLYQLAKAPVDFGKAAQFTNLPQSEKRTLIALQERDLGAGSNNWAVAPDKTSTGRPILANDPHRGHATPSLRYAAHLVAPGLNVIGAGEPALPGISIGHNERIAFGLTIFSIDQEDLMVYRAKGDKYFYRGKWKSMDKITETFQVRDSDPITADLFFTVHGPVIYREKKRAFAVQAAWLEPGMAPYFGSVEYMRATNWNQFLAALNRWGAPSENQVYADIDGNIGYKPAGLAPIRINYDGLLPVPGDGTYEWQGFYDMDQLPVEYNPQRGWVGTANAMSLPDDYPYKEMLLGFEWAYPWRINRIAEVLNRSKPHSLQDSIDLQRDYLSIPARQLLEAIKIEQLPSPANEIFKSWNYVLNKDSRAAALFEIWFSSHLNIAVIKERLGTDDLSGLGALHNNRVVQFFTELPTVKRQGIAEKTMTTALNDIQSLLGADASKWQWGNIHSIQFKHPLHDFVDAAAQEKMQMPGVSRGGSGDTPNSTRYNRNFQVVSGGSWRMVLDVGNWDNAFMTNAPGQSGNPGSDHYSDLLESWADDATLPLVYSRELVEKHTRTIIKLTPLRH